MRKKRKRVDSLALHSAFDHEFTFIDENQTYAIDDQVLKNLEQEIGQEIVPNENDKKKI